MRLIIVLLQTLWVLGPAPSDAAPERGTQPVYHLTIADQERPLAPASPQRAPFQVAPGGRFVAVQGPPGKGLCLIGEDRAERGCEPQANGPFAFSPDGKTLAYAAQAGVFVWNVATGERRRLAGTSSVDGLVWSGDGVVVRFRTSDRHHLILLASGGEKLLATATRIDAFAAAGSTIVYFRQGAICAMDCQPLADQQPILHAAVSPDGARVIFASEAKMYLRDRGGAVRLLDEIGRVHSLDFSRDGSCILWASVERGVLQMPARAVRMPGSASARFRRDAPGLIMTGEEGAITWDPGTGVKTIVGGLMLPEGRTLDADMLAGKPIIYYVRLPSSVKEHAPPPGAQPGN